MRYLAAVVVSLLMGYALGGWSPRVDVRRLEDRVRELERESRRKGSADASLAGITRMLNVPREGDVRASSDRESTPVRRATLHDREDETDPAVSTQSNAAPSLRKDPDSLLAPHRWDEMTPEERLDKAVELWSLRSDLARNSFLSNAGADEAQAVRFDVLVEAMNVRIEASLEGWADRLLSKEITPPEAAARMLHDISGAIALTYDEFDRNMPENWRSTAGDEFQMFDLIDPRVATPLIELENEFDFR